MVNHFTIIVPAYNVKQWAAKNIKSALTQDYDNYDVIYINDASTDETRKIVDSTFQNLIKETSADSKVIHNEFNKKALYNIIFAVKLARPNSIIVTLDGDDRLPHKNVLSSLDEIYSSPDVWMTAGSYVDTLTGLIGSPQVDEYFWQGNIRHKEWAFSHLRTFRKELFLKIDEADMTDKDGEIYKYTFDQVMMFPMAEMSGPEHCVFVKEPLYVYNRDNPISVDRIHRIDQLRIEQAIRNAKTYSKLEAL
jgi:glycosyltransferase involved in cell wall biosynthesis